MPETVTVKQYRVVWVNGNDKKKYRYYRSPEVAGSNVGGILKNGVKELTVTVLEPHTDK